MRYDSFYVTLVFFLDRVKILAEAHKSQPSACRSHYSSKPCFPKITMSISETPRERRPFVCSWSRNTGIPTSRYSRIISIPILLFMSWMLQKLVHLFLKTYFKLQIRYLWLSFCSWSTGLTPTSPPFRLHRCFKTCPNVIDANSESFSTIMVTCRGASWAWTNLKPPWITPWNRGTFMSLLTCIWQVCLNYDYSSPPLCCVPVVPVIIVLV